MKTDIIGRNEIEHLINIFYEKVKLSPIISSMFLHINWDKHLPVMYSFWENALFYTGGYFGNPLKIHQDFSKKCPLKESHFIEWQELFIATVNENFAGEKAELAKQRAISISTVMLIKIFDKDML